MAADSILQSLKGISSYPIPARTLNRVATVRGLNPDDEATADVLKSDAFRLAEADLMRWLANAPNVSEGGSTFSINASQQTSFKSEAAAIYGDLGVEIPTIYGNLGEDL